MAQALVNLNTGNIVAIDHDGAGLNEVVGTKLVDLPDDPSKLTIAGTDNSKDATLVMARATLERAKEVLRAAEQRDRKSRARVDAVSAEIRQAREKFEEYERKKRDRLELWESRLSRREISQNG